MTAAAQTKPGVVFSPDKKTAVHTVGNGKVFTYKEYSGVYYHVETPDEVVRVLDSAHRTRTRLRLHYGHTKPDHPECGRDWMEENDVEGYVSNGPENGGWHEGVYSPSPGRDVRTSTKGALMSKFENANEASVLTDEQRKAVAEALGYEVDGEQIREAIETHKDRDTATLVKELKWKEEAFEWIGGRGVELADEIDSLRIALSARDVTRRPS